MFKEFALVVVDEHGRLKTYTSTSLTPYQRMIFNSVFRSEFYDTVQMARGPCLDSGVPFRALANRLLQDIMTATSQTSSIMRSSARHPAVAARHPAGGVGASTCL